MKKGRLKVLYIAGSGRCGSTTLSMLLGELDGFVNIREGRFLFNRGMRIWDIPYGCGEAVNRCSFWQPIDERISSEAISSATQWLKTRFFPLIKARMLKSLDAILTYVESTYYAVAERTGARVLVDASKHPAYGALLALSDEFDVFVLHLVRDPRGVVSSWSKPKGYLKGHPVFHVTIRWVIHNMLSERITYVNTRYMRVRWEDIVQHEISYLKKIVEFVGEDPSLIEKMPRYEDGSFEIRQQHALAGNPDKLAGRLIKLHLRPWHLRGKDRFLVDALSLPLCKRYGYC